MLLFNVTGGKQKDYVLLDFQENKDIFEKCLYCLLVNVVRSTYAKLAHLDLMNKKIIELIFKLIIPKNLLFSACLRSHGTVS